MTGFRRFEDAGMSMSEAAAAFTRALPSTHEGTVVPSTPEMVIDAFINAVRSGNDPFEHYLDDPRQHAAHVIDHERFETELTAYDDGAVLSGGPCGECDRSWPCWNKAEVCYRLPKL